MSEKRYGKARRIWVMDRGMTSAENLRWLKEGERKYIVGAPRSELKRREDEILERSGWEEIRKLSGSFEPKSLLPTL